MENEVQNTSENNDQSIQKIILKFPDPGKPVRKIVAKLTNQKRKQFLLHLAQRFNKTQAAAAVGVTAQAINFLLERDPQFKAAYDYVLDMHLDNAEATMFVMAAEQSRDGFQDRKLALQSYRRQTYGDKVDVSAKHQVNIDITVQELQGILHSNGVKKINSETKALPTTFEEL